MTVSDELPPAERSPTPDHRSRCASDLGPVDYARLVLVVLLGLALGPVALVFVVVVAGLLFAAAPFALAAMVVVFYLAELAWLVSGLVAVMKAIRTLFVTIWSTGQGP